MSALLSVFMTMMLFSKVSSTYRKGIFFHYISSNEKMTIKEKFRVMKYKRCHNYALLTFQTVIIVLLASVNLHINIEMKLKSEFANQGQKQKTYVEKTEGVWLLITLMILVSDICVNQVISSSYLEHTEQRITNFVAMSLLYVKR